MFARNVRVATDAAPHALLGCNGFSSWSLVWSGLVWVSVSAATVVSDDEIKYKMIALI